MNIPSNFFEAEIRDGYYISSEMKRCWAATIDVLDEIDKICQRHNITYYADYGTMIGAIRHSGFIPWDDDLDICMKRDDYMLFMKVAQEELPESYQVLSYYTNHKYNNKLTRVVNSSFICLEEPFLRAHHDFPFAVGVDVFPLDYLNINETGNDEIRKLINDLLKTADSIKEDLEDETKLTRFGQKGLDIAGLFVSAGYEYDDSKPVRQQVYILADRLMSIYKDEESSELMHAYFWAQRNNHRYKKEYYDDAIRVPFEYTTIPVPIGYDRLLLTDYGPDYMTPIKSGGMHDYPVYGKQKKVMFEILNRYYYEEYVFDSRDLIHNKIEKDETKKKEVVFLPFKAEYWYTMEKEWEKYINNPDYDVFVIPIPYYQKGDMRLEQNLCYEGDLFPEYIGAVGFDKYDFESRKPDKIYINNPFDQYNEGITVHPRFYSEMMKNVTNELIYIPFFITDDFENLEHRFMTMAKDYICVPGVTRADKILVNSEKIRDRYIDVLCEFAGESTRREWNKRVNISDIPMEDNQCIGLFEEDVPVDWWKHLLTDNGNGKKVILYYTSVSALVEYKDKYLTKLESVLRSFRDNSKEITVLWHADSNIEYILRDKYPKLWDKYLSILNNFLVEDYGIYENTEDYSKSVAIADAYYGDRSRPMNVARLMGKPIMIQRIAD